MNPDSAKNTPKQHGRKNPKKMPKRLANLRNESKLYKKKKYNKTKIGPKGWLI